VTAPLIAVWSPKGGTGRTLIAAGLAMHLVRRTERSALLVDLDPGSAGVTALLQTPFRPSVLDYPAGEAQPADHPSGLAVLSGPPRLIDGALVSAELTESLLKKARREYGVVVADLSTSLRDSTVVVLEQAEAVLLVTTPDLLAVYACRRFTQEADLVGLDLRRFRLVINRAQAKQEIPDREIVDLIGVAVAGRVPNLPGLATAVNKGLLTPTFRSNTDFTAALRQLADSLAFAGVPGAGKAARAPAPATGLIPALRRWWGRR
jgi:MinD-like ATPase involved in chromosome partitioning or flagellar assembly